MDTGLAQGSDAWKNERFLHITCTDLAKIMGLDSTCSRKKLLASKKLKKDLMEDANDYLKSLLERGKTYESAACSSYLRWRSETKQMGLGYIPAMLEAPDYPNITGSPDYLFPNDKIVAEFKTHWYPSEDLAECYNSKEQIPPKYFLQVQGYLNITGFQKANLISWTLLNGFSVFEITYDEVLWCAAIRPSCVYFRQMMDSPNSLKDLAGCAIMGSDEKSMNTIGVYESTMSHTRKIK